MINKNILSEKVNEINCIISSYLPAPDGHNDELCEAVKYSVTAGGKRLRPMIMQESFRMFSGKDDEPEILHAMMAAIEFIHTYSLVHDDLPAMDNDDYRRGMLTVHSKYGEAAGILTGDALLNLAFETILTALGRCQDPDNIQNGIRAADILAACSGCKGMAAGQYVDVYSEKHPDFRVDRDCLKYIYVNKTSALLKSAFMAGAVLGKASDAEISLVEKMGEKIGLAFQIRDDILDVIGDQDIIGKPVGSDERNEKQTFVSIFGLEKSQEAVKKYSEEALEIFDSMKGKNAFLRELIVDLINRDK